MLNQNRRLANNKENCQALQNAIVKDQRRPLLSKELNLNFNFPNLQDSAQIDAFCSQRLPISPVPEMPNPQEVVEFQASIFSYLRDKDAAQLINPFYMNDQRDINPKMRSILVDWLIDVHIKFKLLPQTLFMTINLIDRFLCFEQATRQQLQLVGITALMIVCKYEEIYPPLLKDYVAVCDNAYTKEQILEMEGRIIRAVNFEVGRTSCYAFLEQAQLKVKLEPRAHVFVKYILENALFDLNSLRYPNLVLVAGAIFLVNKIFKRENWRLSFEETTGVSEAAAKLCAKDLFATMQKMESISLTALKRKYSTAECFEVSRYRIEKAKN